MPLEFREYLIRVMIVLPAIILNLAFGIIHSVLANWLLYEKLYLTEIKPTFPFPDINSQCNLSKYECSVIFFNKQDDCDLSIVCMSFQRAGGTCEDVKITLANSLIFMSVFSLVQFILWIFFVYMDTASNRMRFQRLKEWNQGGNMCKRKNSDDYDPLKTKLQIQEGY